MKNLVKILLISVLAFGMNSCTEEKILDLEPVNNIGEGDAFSTPSLIEAYMNGVYNAASIGTYNSGTSNGGRGYIWGAAFVEQGDVRGEDLVNTATFYELTYKAQIDAVSPNAVYYWVDGYRLINRCNLMIEGVAGAVAKGIITKAAGDDYIGQAKFLRAITHLELLTFFAKPYNFTSGATHPGVIYREVGVNTQTEISSEIGKPRNSVAECYTKIIADLNDAEALITTGNGTTLAGRNIAKASKWSAIAFKTRLYLQKRDWANVITEGTKLNGVFSLTATPSAPFASTAANLNNSESILSMQHSPTSNPNTNAALASIFKSRTLVAISPIIWRDPNWKVNDKRREEGVMVVTVNGRKYTNKYKDITDLTDAAPVIRYAEVVLNMAEAQARLSTANLPAAITLLNSVRDRSLASPTTERYTSVTLPTQVDVVKAILAERRIEFLAEGRRWTDIHRLQGDDLAPIAGIPAKYDNIPPVPADYALGTPYTGSRPIEAIPYTDRRFLWPIPQIETNTNPGLEQNTGW
ncbi:RagB/SusD family nutrient uptake outer membrane protein [Flavobacterium tructae]|uniref:RagB/SusD family nutrient uptake outer membrane protein n=1 Tax=Flavobacterium tructae TaxID=1114873 RepID=UPI000B5B826D|nr:RagB/SusD family nutrient uptake outer membrane protein [Flavobacterium tructae]OXB23812.1 RagB/SusD family nutrient uptake outer membrane protein [Flavobacterium tructae]